jgi:hypothetical protein
MGIKNSKIVAGIAVFAVAGSIISVWRTMHRTEGPNLELFRAVGRGVAEQTAGLVGKQKELVLVAWDPKRSPFPDVDAQANAFIKAAKKLGLSVVATQLLPLTSDGTRGVPGEQFLELGRRFPTAVIVSFVGPPLLTAEQLRGLPASRPKCVVVTAEVDWQLKRALLKHVIDLAFLPGRRPVSAESKSTSPPYLILTPDTAADLPF